MPVNAHHPEYDERLPDWELVEDAFEGERVVKDAGLKYLPPTAGHLLDGMLQGQDGLAAYESYKLRAVFPDFTETAVATLVGILNAKPVVVTLPPQMQYLLDKASSEGESFKQVVARLHEYQLRAGRAGVLVDFVSGADPKPYLAVYPAKKILNWDDGGVTPGFSKLNLVVLDETTKKRDSDFSWQDAVQTRVLQLGNLEDNESTGFYKHGLFQGRDAEYDDASMTEAVLVGKPIDEIPFVFVNTKDCLAATDKPPLLAIARLCMTIYRGEADYRHTLYMQGQETLTVIGGIRQSSIDPTNPTGAVRVGAGARLDVEVGGDAKYVGVSSLGLAELRSALENDKKQASVQTGQLLAPGKMSMESGEALKTRVAAQTATLTSIANTCAFALQTALRMLAKWKGLDPSTVTVIPNLDFTNMAIQGQDLVQVMTAKNLGYPLSYQTIFELAAERGLTRTTFEEEMERIKKDPDLLISRAKELMGGLNGNNPTNEAGGTKTKPAFKNKQTNEPAN